MTSRLAAVLTAVLLFALPAAPAAALELDPEFTPPSNIGQAVSDLATLVGQTFGPDQFARRSDQLMRQLGELFTTETWSVSASPIVLAQAPALADELLAAVRQVQADLEQAVANVQPPADEYECEPDTEYPLPAALPIPEVEALLSPLLGGLPTLPLVDDVDADGLLNAGDTDLDGDGLLDLDEVTQNAPDLEASFLSTASEASYSGDVVCDKDHAEDHGKKKADESGEGKKDESHGDDDHGRNDEPAATPVSNTLPRTGGGAAALPLAMLAAGAGLTAWLRKR